LFLFCLDIKKPAFAGFFIFKVWGREPSFLFLKSAHEGAKRLREPVIFIFK